MYRKLALGLVAAVSLTAAASLAPTAASAHGWHGHHHHHHHGWGHGWRHRGFGPVFIAGGYDRGCYVTRRVLTKYGYRLRTFNVCY